MNEKNRNLAVRIGSAAVLLPLVLSLLWLGGDWSAGLMGAAAAICAWEYYTITQGKVSAAAGVGIALCLLAPIWAAGNPPRAGERLFWMVGGYFLFAWGFHLLRGPLAEAPTRVAHLITGMLYGALGLTALSLLRARNDGLSWVYCVLILTWGNDTSAYFVGRWLGRRKLYPEVSPNKTWEGAAGGLVGSLVGMLIARSTFFPALTIPDCLIAGAIGGAVGPIGDLCESMLKRAYHVKDSGKIIPGHGGLLDRLDALLFNAPAVFLYVNFFRGNSWS